MGQEVTVSTIGVSQQEGAPVVVLSADEEVVPVLVTPDQAHAIQLALGSDQFERPLTHDVLVDVITEFGGAVDRVRIDALHDGTFLAKIDVERYSAGERQTVTFDARASDAVAIGLRVDCPIELSDAVVEAAGRSRDEFTVEGYDE